MRGCFEQQMPESKERTVMMEQKFTRANKGREKKADFSSFQFCFKCVSLMFL
jgi:phage tail tube protein FII